MDLKYDLEVISSRQEMLNRDIDHHKDHINALKIDVEDIVKRLNKPKRTRQGQKSKEKKAGDE
jgi:hypothetical protein